LALIAAGGLGIFLLAKYGPASGEEDSTSAESDTGGNELWPYTENDAPSQPQDSPSEKGPGWWQSLFGFGNTSVNPDPYPSPDYSAPSDSLRGIPLKYASEGNTIIRTADSIGIDARFLAALRVAEGGGPGREYGVLSVPAPTYLDQVTIAARTIKNNLARYSEKTGLSAIGRDGRYTSGFINFFSNIYAPVGASNDPGLLNQYQAGNLRSNYAAIDYA